MMWERTCRFSRAVAALALGISLAAGDTEAAPRAGGVKPRPAAVARLELTPADLRLYGAEARDQVYVTAVLTDGRRQDVTDKAIFRALGPAVRASAGGRVAAVGNGATKVAVRYGGREA